ncbi:reverse transcriptase/maturase family protein [Proteiniphilum sp.]|nr:reverse transcriptase/maturase family protein [Proteiniphilum sp.]MEA4918129.1 reverse transcriptase/maturase family protein [Proteiniphilum sp.]
MKRIGYLYDKICSLDNLILAYQKARKGKAKQYGVKLFEKDVNGNLIQIQQELLNLTYRTPEYKTYTVYDPKEREISCLPFSDRVVHHAIMNILEPIWTSIFIRNTYSCIKGRGIHGVLRHLKRDLKDVENTRYCLKIDTRKFYPSIDHDILKDIIRKKIKDPRLLNLLDEIIDSSPGVPIGSYLSQFFANLCLSYLDHWLKEDHRVRYYYRYADDVVILAKSKEYLHALLVEINDYMATRLNLRLKGNYQIFPVAARGIDVVGYRFYHTHVLLRKTIKKSLCRRAARLNKMNLTAKEYRMRIAPWTGWAKHCNSKHLLKVVIDKYEEVC